MHHGTELPPPRLERVGDVLVVRDDEVQGGTKRRVLPLLLGDAEEYVYATPAYGYAQVAIAHTCKAYGKRATIFVAKRSEPHDRTREAAAAGARVIQVPHGYLSNVQAKARAYAEAAGATCFPFGLDVPVFHTALSGIAASLDVDPPEVWCVAGSGALGRALEAAWPKARHYRVRVGAVPNVGGAQLFNAPEKFEQLAKAPPPFPSCANYDAKAWQFVKSYAKPGALFWNVAA